MEIWVWTALIVVSAVLEFFTSELISIWFTASGIVSLILAFCGVSLTIQVIVFVVLAFVLIIALRKVCLKILKKTDIPTNADSVIGTQVTLLEDITTENLGQAKINGIVWSVTGENGFVAKKGEKVYVKEIKGNKLIVKGGNK